LVFCLLQFLSKLLDFVGTLACENLPAISASLERGDVVAQPFHVVFRFPAFPFPTVSAFLEEPKQLQTS
jgi:hypothetical protein